MSERSTSTSLEEKCYLSLAPESELDTSVNQDKSEKLPDLYHTNNSLDIKKVNVLSTDKSNCDKLLRTGKKLCSVSKELGETDICPEALSSQSDTIDGEVKCKDIKLSPEEARTNGLICSLSDKVITDDPSLSQNHKSILQTNEVTESDQSANKSFIDNLSPEICKLETTVNNYNFNKHSSDVNFESKLKSVSNDEICNNHCGSSIKTDLIGKGNIEEADDNQPLASSDNASPEHELEEGDDKSMDEIYHVPKNPVFNGNLSAERRSNLKRKAIDTGNENGTKRKRTIQFEGVTVFYFPRSQGFTCVPSQGGSTLGMSRRHFTIKNFSLAEHAAEQRKSHRDYLLRLRQQRNNLEIKETGSQCSSSEESEENSEEASDVSDSELESDSFFFLQPLPIRQRRALLRQSGIRQIEGLEKDECKDIRISREMCGCQCKVYCDPNTCQCSQAGIKCQVDRHSFPCGCSRDGCSNPNGRIEFNPIRVRTHFLHTLMRLEIEKCQNHHQHWSVQQQQDHSHQLETNDNLDRSKSSTSSASSWLQTNSSESCSTSAFVSSGNITNSLPFFTSQNSASLQMNTSGEMHPCNVGSSALYSPFEVRQLNNNSISAVCNNSGSNSSNNNNGNNSSLIHHDNDGDYNTGGCSMFSDAVMTSFDSVSPLLSYGGNAGGSFASQGGFSSHFSYSHSHSKLPTSSPFSISSFSYSAATAAAAAAAAAVSVVSPGSCSYSLQNSFSSNDPVTSNGSSCMSLDKFSPSNVYTPINAGMCGSQEFSCNYDSSSAIQQTKLNSFSLPDMLSDLTNESSCPSNSLHSDFSQCSALADHSRSSDCLETQNATQSSADVVLHRQNHSQFTVSSYPSQASTSGKNIIDTFSGFDSFSSLSCLPPKSTADHSDPSSASSVTSNLLYNGCNVQSSLDLCLDFCANNSNLTHSGTTSMKNTFEICKNENILNGILSSQSGKPSETENCSSTTSVPNLNEKVSSVEMNALIGEEREPTAQAIIEDKEKNIISPQNNFNDYDDKLCFERPSLLCPQFNINDNTASQKCEAAGENQVKTEPFINSTCIDVCQKSEDVASITENKDENVLKDFKSNSTTSVLELNENLITKIGDKTPESIDMENILNKKVEETLSSITEKNNCESQTTYDSSINDSSLDVEAYPEIFTNENTAINNNNNIDTANILMPNEECGDNLVIPNVENLPGTKRKNTFNSSPSPLDVKEAESCQNASKSFDVQNKLLATSSNDPNDKYNSNLDKS